MSFEIGKGGTGCIVLQKLLKRIISLPNKNAPSEKTASRIPVSVRSAKSLSVRKRIKDHFSSPTLLSATKKRIKEEFSSPWVSYNEA